MTTFIIRFLCVAVLAGVGGTGYVFAQTDPSGAGGSQSGLLEVLPEADGTVLNTTSDNTTVTTIGDGAVTEDTATVVQPTVFTGTLDDPLSVHAQGERLASNTLGSLTIAGLLQKLKGILNAVIPFIIGLTVLVIIWGIFTYVTEAANEEKRTEAKQFILYGIIGLFCMLSIWGLVNILVGTFGLTNKIEPGQIPTVPTIIPIQRP